MVKTLGWDEARTCDVPYDTLPVPTLYPNEARDSSKYNERRILAVLQNCIAIRDSKLSEVKSSFSSDQN